VARIVRLPGETPRGWLTSKKTAEKTPDSGDQASEQPDDAGEQPRE
jgi:hypothetical protein